MTPDTTTQFESSSSTPSVQLGFSEWDILVAKALVRKLVKAQLRPGPSELLVLSESAIEEWLREDAIAFLKEQKARRQEVVAEIR